MLLVFFSSGNTSIIQYKFFFPFRGLNIWMYMRDEAIEHVINKSDILIRCDCPVFSVHWTPHNPYHPHQCVLDIDRKLLIE